MVAIETGIEALVEVTSSFVNDNDSLRVIIEAVIAMVSVVSMVPMMAMMTMMALFVYINLNNVDMGVHNFI